MSDRSAPLSGEILDDPNQAPSMDARKAVDVSRQIVTQLHNALEGPAEGMLSLSLALVMIHRMENRNAVTDDEFVNQIAKSLRMLCEEPGDLG